MQMLFIDIWAAVKM